MTPTSLSFRVLSAARTGMALLALILAGNLVGDSTAHAQAPAPTDAVLAEARQAYDATDYERASSLLDSVIAGLGSSPKSADQRQVLVAAYELRARTRFNLQNLDGTRADFRAMLFLDPAHLLTEQVGPRIMPIFDEVKKTTVGIVSIKVTPPDAQVTLDDGRLQAEAAALTLVGGMHTLSAARTGFKAASQQFAVVPGGDAQTITLVLERISSTLALVTSPANITVVVDGIDRGVTELDPDAKGTNGALMSKRFLVTDLQNGRHKVEFRRECFVGTEVDVDVQMPNDYRINPVTLNPAVATVNVNATALGATVFVDDAPRGPAPMTMDDICQGKHIVEVRTAFGRHVRRLDLKAGDREAFQAYLRPAFALVTDSGAAAAVRGGPDLRIEAEKAFQESRTVTLFAPSENAAKEALAAESLPPDWLWFDILRRPLEGARTIAEQARGEFATRLARKLNAQGIAAVAREPGSDPAAMLLILLAPGSSEPDVFRWRLDNQQSIRDAVRELDQAHPLFQSSIGVMGIDVEDVEGVVVASTDRGGSAEKAGVRVGEIITGAGGAPTRGVVDLQLAIRARNDGKPLSLDVTDRAGTTRKVDVAIDAVPNVVSLAAQDLAANKLLLEYTYRAATLSGPLDEAAVRLNLAALSLRVKNRGFALQELKRVLDVVGEGKIQAPLSDSIAGTAQYLTGVAAEASGDTRAAEAAWRQAIQSQGTLLVNDSGGAIKELSEQQLNLLSSTGRP